MYADRFVAQDDRRIFQSSRRKQRDRTPVCMTAFPHYRVDADQLYSVEALAKKKNISMAQVALAWCLSKDPVSAPIVGTTNLSNLEDLIGEPNKPSNTTYATFFDLRHPQL